MRLKMAGQRTAASVLGLAVVLVAGVLASVPTVRSIGVCNGMQGDGLPSATDVVQLYQSNNIAAMRIYAPDDGTLQALGGTGIGLVMDVGNGNLGTLASDPSAASDWVRTNVQAYPGVSFRCIAVGNEVMDSDGQSKILPAMHNINDALAAAGLGAIKVSTAVRFDVVAHSYPPSNGVFSDPSYMGPIVQLLASSGAPLLANVYPYFAYQGDQGIDLNYALFQPSSKTVTDNGLTYTNLFDAIVDAIYSAMEKAGAPGVPIVVSESGWPSDGGVQATVDNARMYNQGLINHVGNGTPKRADPIETYVFAMFNENRKPGPETEKHFGLFNGPDKSSVYPITFT